MTTKNLDGKIALVTGGSRGIGAAIVAQLAARGARVVFTYQKSVDQAQKVANDVVAAGGQATALQADAEDPSSMQGVVDQVVKAHGKIDILVNNAGVFLIGPVGKFSLTDYDRMMNINVNSVYALTHYAVPHIKPGGRIINISSVLGERASGPAMAAYAATKAAVLALAKGWAHDLGAQNITVNAVLPGSIDTDMNPEAGPYAAAQKQNTVWGRYGKPDDIASMVTYLAGDEASNITGSAIAVDGGRNA